MSREKKARVTYPLKKSLPAVYYGVGKKNGKSTERVFFMNIMLDNAAACRPYSWAAELFAEKCRSLYANQESAGKLGVESAKAVAEAADRLSSVLAPGYGVMFCNTGTDALRAAVFAALSGKRNPVSLTTRAEHPALLRALAAFPGTEYCRVGRTGAITIPGDCVPDFFAVHHVNAETGILQDFAVLKKQLPEKTVFLLDTTQSVCKVSLPETLPDFLTISGCKVGAPCGAALLYRKSFEKKIRALRLEEHGIGRCVPAAAVVLSETVVRGVSRLRERYSHAERLNRILRDRLSGLQIRFTAENVPASPWILHFMLSGREGGILVRMLQERGITVAAGSACSSETPKPSAVLTAMGFSARESYSALRVSFFDDTTEEDVLIFANTLHEVLKNY